MIIGIIGAQGNFGSKLEKRLLEIGAPDVEIMGTKSRSDTEKIIRASDVLILTVPQSNSAELFKQINLYSKKEVLVISFLAHYPIKKVGVATKRNVIRAMADPWFNFSAFIKNDIETPVALDFYFDTLTKVKPFNLQVDEEIDLFTVNFCYLFVVLLLHKQGILNYLDIHLEYLSKNFNLSNDDLLKLTPNGDPQELLALLATKGGITEMINTLLISNPGILPEDIIKNVSEKFI